MWRYLRDQKESYLYYVPLLLMLGFTTMEVTFITTGIFLLFLDYILAQEFVDQMRAKRDMTQQDIVLAYVVLLPTAWAIAALWPLLEGARRRWGLETMPAAGNFLVIMGTFTLPQLAAGVQKIPLLDLGNADVPNDPGENNLKIVTTLIFLFASAYIGLMWNWRIWSIGAAIFYVPFVLLYTTFFTNLPGFWTGIWGSLDYWLGQQLVRRGGQPDYYYLMTTPLYEFLPLIFATGGALYYAFKGKVEQQLLAFGALALVLIFTLADDGIPFIDHYHLQLAFIVPIVAVMLMPIERFTKFLLFWTLSTFFAITIAGERMPWLTIHIALPIVILAAKVFDDIFSSIGVPKAAEPEPAPAPARGRRKAQQPVEEPAGLTFEQIAPLVYVAVLAALATLVFVMAGPASAASIIAWLLAGAAAVVFLWTANSYGWRMAGQVAALGLAASLLIFTLRAAGMAAYDEGDPGGVPPEMLIYAQGSPELDNLRDQIDQLAATSGMGRELKIVLDNGEGTNIWPWPWYLRDYEGHGLSYTGVQEGFKPDPGAVLLLANDQETVNRMSQYTDFYQEPIPYTHMWWFPEHYKGLSTSQFLSDFFSGHYFPIWRDYFIDRDLGVEPGGADRNAYFPIDVFADADVEPDPYVAQEIDLTDQEIIGAPGSEEGQLQQPADMAIDADGNLWVVDTLNARIQRFAPNGDVSAFGAEGTGEDQFEDPFSDEYQNHDGPWGIAVDAAGNVYVADTWNHFIKKFDDNGQFVAGFGGPELGFFGPRDVDVDADGNLLVVDTGNKRIVKLSPDGAMLETFDGAASEAGTFDEPTSIAIAPNGDIYVADIWNGRIVHLDEDFTFIDEIRVTGWGDQGITNKAYLVVLPTGEIVATDPANGHILVFTPGEEQPRAWKLAANAQDHRPVGLAPDAGGNVYISDGIGGNIRRLPVAALLAEQAPAGTPAAPTPTATSPATQ
jgi:DNA-binding beta-propeller fold protein YncE